MKSEDIIIPLGKLASTILFILWCTGNTHIQIWHWIVPYAFDVGIGMFIQWAENR